tara:strand:- start:265 stop:477 length:213 start_codon:yes stop_codon:yes gene_type:complete
MPNDLLPILDSAVIELKHLALSLAQSRQHLKDIELDINNLKIELIKIRLRNSEGDEEISNLHPDLEDEYL